MTLFSSYVSPVHSFLLFDCIPLRALCQSLLPLVVIVIIILKFLECSSNHHLFPLPCVIRMKSYWNATRHCEECTESFHQCQSQHYSMTNSREWWWCIYAIRSAAANRRTNGIVAILKSFVDTQQKRLSLNSKLPLLLLVESEESRVNWIVVDSHSLFFFFLLLLHGLFQSPLLVIY